MRDADGFLELPDFHLARHEEGANFAAHRVAVFGDIEGVFGVGGFAFSAVCDVVCYGYQLGCGHFLEWWLGCLSMSVWFVVGCGEVALVPLA